MLTSLSRLAPLAPPTSTYTSSDELDGIGHAFFAALDRDGGPAVTVAIALVLALLFGLLARWVVREAARERAEHEARTRAYEAAIMAAGAEAKVGPGAREWVRVNAAVPMTVCHRDARGCLLSEDCTTRNLSGGGGAFVSTRPPALGKAVELKLDLGEPRSFAVRGVVVRVDEVPSRRGTQPEAVVGVKLGPITNREREHLVRWVAQANAREVAAARRGRLCARCGRPLAPGAGEVHARCGAPTSTRPPRPSGRPTWAVPSLRP